MPDVKEDREFHISLDAFIEATVVASCATEKFNEQLRSVNERAKQKTAEQGERRFDFGDDD